MIRGRVIVDWSFLNHFFFFNFLFTAARGSSVTEFKDRNLDMDQNDLLSLERTDLRWYQRIAVGTTPLGDFMLI